MLFRSARSISASDETGAFAKTVPVAGLIMSNVSCDVDGTDFPLMKFCNVFTDFSSLSPRLDENVDLSLVISDSDNQEFRSSAASWPQAPSISRPRVSRTVTATP